MDYNSVDKFNTDDSVQVIMNNDVAEVIQRCIDQNIFYGIFPVEGESMTCDDDRSIPSESGVLVFDLQIDLQKPLINLIDDIPHNEPLVIHLKNNDDDEGIYVVKTISFVDTINQRLRLTAYNEDPGYSGWVRSYKIRGIFKVIQIISKEDLKN